MSGSARMALARRIAAELREREGRNLLAVGVYGSVARGRDREHSDVDLYVLVRRKRAWIGHLVRGGDLVTISQHTPDEGRAEVAGSGPWLCEKLGGWRSMRALHDPSRLLARLTARAGRSTAAQFRGAARKDLIEVYEDYGKLLNAVAAGDAVDAREMSLWFTGGAASALLDIEGRTIRTDHEIPSKVRRSGTTGREILRLRYATLSLRETERLARRIWADLLGRAARRGVHLPPGLTRASARSGPCPGR